MMKEQVLGWLGAAVTSVLGGWGLQNWQGEEGQWVLIVPDGDW